jgi:hypothetical protein
MSKKSAQVHHAAPHSNAQFPLGTKRLVSSSIRTCRLARNARAEVRAKAVDAVAGVGDESSNTFSIAEFARIQPTLSVHFPSSTAFEFVTDLIRSCTDCEQNRSKTALRASIIVQFSNILRSRELRAMH